MIPLVVENLSKVYRQGERTITALRQINLEVPSGQLLAVMGASGSGKSTLLHLMAGLTNPDSGRILINGQDITPLSDRQLTLFRRRHIGLVFQAFNLVPTLTARQNVALPLMLEGKSLASTNGKVEGLLEMLGLAQRADHRPDLMSGGEQQRVAIGRALVSDPAIILADEPTGNLDSANSHSVCQLLAGLCQQQGKTIVMVTHEPSVAAFAQQIAVMRDGRIIDHFAVDGASAQDLAMRYQQCLPA